MSNPIPSTMNEKGVGASFPNCHVPVSLPLTLVLFLTLFSAALPGGSGHPAGGEQQLTAGARYLTVGGDGR
ncbi:hypothetical protein OPV22_008411 [Ensete ventricosum]|uniref:Uncharacterized protein n=1 Tax=Ensete ventricosum TaxID=4639 RepID=A0AAV8PPN3_ENSVE|nr:hypothetical protein OPV22_008411 [Ensete ventricosum]